MTTRLQDFSDKLAAIMPEIGSDRLPSLLLSMLKGMVPFDNALIIHYYRSEIPQVHYNDIPPLERESQIDLFINGAYLLDPFYVFPGTEYRDWPYLDVPEGLPLRQQSSLPCWQWCLPTRRLSWL